MPSLADLVQESKSGSQQWTNADLTPAARRKRLGIEDVPVEDPREFGRGGHMPTPNGPVESEQQRLIDDAKGTLAKADPFARMIENAGNVGAQESLRSHEGAGEAAARSLGDTAVGVMKGAAQIPGDLLGGVLGLPGAIAQGYESIPEGLQAIIDPATWRGMPDAAKQTFLELADDPEAATRLFGGMLAAGPAAELAGKGVAAAPAAAGKAISATGRGLQAAGNSPLVEGTGLLRKMGAVMHPGLGTLAGAVGPEMLTGLGKATEALGGKVSNIPNSRALQGLKDLGNKDLGLAAKKLMTPELTADEQAASSVRATVDTAKRGVEGGMSRAQADQRAGWPLGESTAEKHTTPGADVKAQWPYEPHVRGVEGNVISGGDGVHQQNNPKTPWKPAGRKATASPASLSALDDLAGPTQRARDNRPPPEVYANGLLDQPGSQQYMSDQFAKNKPIADRAQGKGKSLVDLDEAERAKQAYLDAAAEDDTSDLSTLDRLSRLSRKRATAPAFAGNSFLSEGRY